MDPGGGTFTLLPMSFLIWKFWEGGIEGVVGLRPKKTPGDITTRGSGKTFVWAGIILSYGKNRGGFFFNFLGRGRGVVVETLSSFFLDHKKEKGGLFGVEWGRVGRGRCCIYPKRRKKNMI